MKNYYLNDEEKKEFIEGYKVIGDNVVVSYANGKELIYPYSDEFITKTKLTMTSQGYKLLNDFYKLRDPISRDIFEMCVASGILSCIPMYFINKKLLLLPVFIGLLTDFIILFIRRIKMNEEYKKIYMYFSVEDILNDCIYYFKNIENDLVDMESMKLYKELTEKVYSGLNKRVVDNIKENNAEFLNINTLDLYTLTDINRINKNFSSILLEIQSLNSKTLKKSTK